MMNIMIFNIILCGWNFKDSTMLTKDSDGTLYG